MYLEVTNPTSLLDEKLKMSMFHCSLTAYPTENSGSLAVQFAHENFKKLLLASNVDTTLIEQLLECKKLREQVSAERKLTDNEHLFPYDEEDFEDLSSVVDDMSEFNNEDEEVTVSLVENSLNQKIEAVWADYVKVFDLFPERLELMRERRDEANKVLGKSKTTTWSEIDYLFEEDGIVVCEELDFKIKGKPYQKLLVNTKDYVEKHAPYLLEKYFEKSQNKITKQKELLEYVQKKEYHEWKFDDDKDIKKMIALSKSFAQAFGFYNGW